MWCTQASHVPTKTAAAWNARGAGAVMTQRAQVRDVVVNQMRQVGEGKTVKAAEIADLWARRLPSLAVVLLAQVAAVEVEARRRRELVQRSTVLKDLASIWGFV